MQEANLHSWPDSLKMEKEIKRKIMKKTRRSEFFKLPISYITIREFLPQVKAYLHTLT